MKILVTGGAGFIGSHFVRTMLDGDYPGYEDAQVTVLDKLTYAGSRNNLPKDNPLLTFVQGSVCDQDLISDLVPGHDAVVHFAAESHVDRSIASAAQFVRTNVEGTQVLLAGCLSAGIERIVHVSTDEVYGSVTVGSSTEDSPLLPSSPYAASKAAADLVALSYWRTHGLGVCITRTSNSYGTHQHPEKFLALSVTNLLRGLPVPLYGDGLHVREWLHVADHCKGVQLVLASGSPGEIYNVGGGTALTNLSLARRLIELCDADPASIVHVADRKGHDRRYALDTTKLSRELGYSPVVRFDDGLEATVKWYRDNANWWATKVHPQQTSAP